MSKFVHAAKVTSHFLDRLLGVEFHHDVPGGRCGGSPDAASIGYCNHVGPHGPHPVSERPTYDSEGNDR